MNYYISKVIVTKVVQASLSVKDLTKKKRQNNPVAHDTRSAT